MWKLKVQRYDGKWVDMYFNSFAKVVEVVGPLLMTESFNQVKISEEKNLTITLKQKGEES